MDSEPDNRAQPQLDSRLGALQAALQRVQARFRLLEAASLAPWAIALGLGASLVLAVVWRFEPGLPLPVLLLLALGLVAVACATVLLYARLRPRELMATARRADHALSLDERLSTALEAASRPHAKVGAEMASLLDAQMDDAVAAVSRIVPARDLPLRVDRRRLLPSLAMVLLLVAAIFVPLPGIVMPDRAVQQQVSTEQKNIEALKQQVQNLPDAGTDPTLQQLLQELSQLSKDLSNGELSREQAMARLSEAESQLQRSLDPQAPAHREALDQLARQLANSNSEAAKEAGKALQSGDTNKAADALKKAGQDAGSMTPAERKALSDSLKQARDQVAPLDPTTAQSLNDAANALDSNDSQASQRALENLSQQVRDTGQRLADQQQVQQSLGQIQQSKSNIAQAGSPTAATTAVAQATASGTDVPGTPISGTPVSGAPTAGTPIAGTPISGTPLSGGTAIAVAGSPVPGTSSPASGTPVVTGSPVTGQLMATGTPVLVPGTPGSGTAVAAQNPGQGNGGNQGNSGSQGQESNSSNGSGSQGQGSGQNGTGSNGGSGSNNGVPAGGWGVGHQEPVYSPPSNVTSALTPVAVQGKESANGEQSSTTTNTDVNNTGPALVPYEQVYRQYREQAGSALNGDYIPQGYKDLVKDYFSSIDPNQK